MKTPAKKSGGVQGKIAELKTAGYWEGRRPSRHLGLSRPQELEKRQATDGRRPPPSPGRRAPPKDIDTTRQGPQEPTKATESRPDDNAKGRSGPKEAIAFLDLLDRDADSFTFQTFDGNDKRRDRGLAKILHGTLDEHADALADLNRPGAGVLVAVNQTDANGLFKTSPSTENWHLLKRAYAMFRIAFVAE